MRAPHLLYIRCGARFVCEIGAKMVLVLFFSVMSIFLFDTRSFDFVFCLSLQRQAIYRL